MYMLWLIESKVEFSKKFRVVRVQFDCDRTDAGRGSPVGDTLYSKGTKHQYIMLKVW